MARALGTDCGAVARKLLATAFFAASFAAGNVREVIAESLEADPLDNIPGLEGVLLRYGRWDNENVIPEWWEGKNRSVPDVPSADRLGSGPEEPISAPVSGGQSDYDPFHSGSDWESTASRVDTSNAASHSLLPNSVKVFQDLAKDPKNIAHMYDLDAATSSATGAASARATRAQPESIAVTPYVPPAGHTFDQTFTETVAVAPQADPGGISLSRAAAMRLKLGINVEGAYYDKGRIVVAGRPSRGEGVDAALLLTGLRLACESGDPFFSLDPDNGRAWLTEGQEASNALLSQINKQFEPRDQMSRCIRRKGVQDPVRIRSVSARRDYPGIWRLLEGKYPNLKSRLVFRPEWLRKTRFGEILYKADVLLKELSGGLPAVRPSGGVRAETIEGYLSVDRQGAARRLLQALEQNGASGNAQELEGYRLWFDLMPQVGGVTPGCNSAACIMELLQSPIITPFPDVVLGNNRHHRQSDAADRLRGILTSYGYLNTRPTRGNDRAQLAAYDHALDLSELYPKLFVRRHDQATGRDLPGSDVDLDALAGDVNSRTDRYASTYEELHELAEVFRAYVVGVKVTQQDSSICKAIRKLPALLPAEMTAETLPEHHPSEIFLTMATYVFRDGRLCYQRGSTVLTTNGGISLRGKELYSIAAGNKAHTAITRELITELGKNSQKAAWTSDTGRQYITFLVDKGPVPAIEKSGPVDSITVQTYMAREEEAARNAAVAAAIENERRTEARRKEERAEQQRKLRTVLGRRIDRKAFNLVLPYGVMARNACKRNSELVGDAKVEHLASWEEVLAKSGRSEGYIGLLKSIGFCGEVYRSLQSGEITIAFGGREALEDMANSGVSRVGTLDLLSKGAGDVAWAVKLEHPKESVSLTGDAVGGALAAYAGEQTGITKVVAFNAVGVPSLARDLNVDRVDVTVLGSAAR